MQSLDQSVNHFDYSQINDPGFTPLRRLTHTQYDNTVRDLFGVDLKPAARFTTELTGSSGFDNSANTLFLEPALMERYIAAERVVEAAIPVETTTPEHRRTRELIFLAGPGGTVSEPHAAQKIVKRWP